MIIYQLEISQSQYDESPQNWLFTSFAIALDSLERKLKRDIADLKPGRFKGEIRRDINEADGVAEIAIRIGGRHFDSIATYQVFARDVEQEPIDIE